MRRGFVLLLVLSPCVSTLISADQSEPEKTVRDFWAKQRKEAVKRAESHIDSSIINRFYTAKAIEYDRQTYRNIIAQNNSTDTAKLTIETVKFPTKTNAVVLTSEPRADGRPQIKKYVLIDNSGRWLIDDILETCFNCRGTGEADDWTSLLSDTTGQGGHSHWAKIQCPYCDGTGWHSLIFYDWQKIRRKINKK